MNNYDNNKAKTPYTGPSQVVTMDTAKKFYVDVFTVARRMTLHAGVWCGGSPVQRSNLSADKFPGLWAVANLLKDTKKQVNPQKFYIKLTFQEIEAADPELAEWLRRETTRAFFIKENYYGTKQN